MSKTDEAERCYYILDTRSVVGNCAMWWRPSGSGYTCELTKAGLYPEAEARSHRTTDVPVHRDVAQRLAVTHVRLGHLRDAGVMDEHDLRRDVACAWTVGATEAVAEDDVEVSVEPFEGSESTGFVARAKVRGIKLSEVAEDRDTAMTKLVEAARARGQMERER